MNSKKYLSPFHLALKHVDRAFKVGCRAWTVQTEREKSVALDTKKKGQPVQKKKKRE